MKSHKSYLIRLGVLILMAAVFMFPLMDDIGLRVVVVQPGVKSDFESSYPAPDYTPIPPVIAYPAPVVPTEVIMPTLPVEGSPTPLPTVPPPPTPDY